MLTESTRERLLDLESQKKTLKEGLAEPAPAPYPALHPNLVGLYKRKVAALEEALADPEIRSEAGEILRGLVDRIEITPAPISTGNSGGDDPVPDAESSTRSSEVAVILYGELAAVIGLAEENEAIETKRGFSLSAGPATSVICRYPKAGCREFRRFNSGARNHRELTLQVSV